ncbi:MAG: thioredoxin [Geobacteraceae bacterium]|nr:MAG: thioredoxin [Geobacteraceae bacterium]
MAGELAGRGAVVQVNTEENPVLATRFGIRGIPAVLLLEKGKVITRQEGALDRTSLLNWFLNAVK